MKEKKHNKRKYAAVALALVGVAGLSVASAATLNVNAANEVAIGTATFAACHEAGDVAVSYTYSDTNYTFTNLTVSGIDAKCNGKAISVGLKNAAGGSLASLSGTVADGAFTKALPGSIPIATNLGDVTVVIG
ncbi:MAG: hypothetical protein ACK4MD_02720 [Demequina sp.]